MMRAIFYFISVFFTVTLNAQDGKRMFLADMDSMQRYASVTQKMSAELVVVNKGVENFIPEIRATMHRDGDLVYYKVLHLEYLFGSKRSIIVNHRSRTIAYSTRDGKVDDIFPTVPSLDSLAKIYDSVVYIGLVNGSRKYQVYCSRYYINKIDFYYNPSTHFVSKLIYHYNREVIGEDAVVTVEYRDVNLTPVFGQGEFSENRFIRTDGKQYMPAAALTGYSVSEAKTDMGKH